MKYPHETEEEFIKRVKESKKKGICVFRDDNNRELILDIIDDYIDVVDAVTEKDHVAEVGKVVENDQFNAVSDAQDHFRKAAKKESL